MVIAFTQNAKTDFTHCSFCGMANNDKEILLTGMNGAICENCIADAKNTLMKDVGVLDPACFEQLNLKKTLNKRITLIIITLVVAIVIVVLKSIFN